MEIWRHRLSHKVRLYIKLSVTLLLVSTLFLYAHPSMVNAVSSITAQKSDNSTKHAVTGPAAVNYTSFNGDRLTLYAYVGANVALLAPTPDLDRATVEAMVDTFDSIYTFYTQSTGRTPTLYAQYEGRGTVAVVPSTCGYGCGYLGFTGIELLNEAFDLLYTGVRDRNEYDQTIFYEFGRNFWFYGDQIEYHGADGTGAVTTGYAVFMRFMAIKATGVTPGPFNGHDFTDFEHEVIGLLDRYLERVMHLTKESERRF